MDYWYRYNVLNLHPTSKLICINLCLTLSYILHVIFWWDTLQWTDVSACLIASCSELLIELNCKLHSIIVYSLYLVQHSESLKEWWNLECCSWSFLSITFAKAKFRYFPGKWLYSLLYYLIHYTIYLIFETSFCHCPWVHA